MHDPDTTIVAVATPAGRGGIGCVRLSGPDARTLGERMFREAKPTPAPSGSTPAGATSQTAKPERASGPDRRAPLDPPRFGRFVDASGEAVDHGYLVTFPEGRSYTGEPTAELWAHGSPAVLDRLLRAACRLGAEPAGPGEFTYRALRSGRIDLARAEAIRDLIEARSAYQAKVAFAQAEGALSDRIEPLRETLADCIANAEAAVEFVDESDVHLPEGSLVASARRVLESCDRLREGFRVGRWVREGASVALVGIPNVGKSSLFNAWLQEERAIVTEVPGTTRDVLEATAVLDGIPLRFVDTAGLRDTDERVEREGIARARRARDEADRVLLLLDGSSGALDSAEREALARLADPDAAARTWIVWNKADLVDEAHRSTRDTELAAFLEIRAGHAGRAAAGATEPGAGEEGDVGEALWVSALHGTGFDALRDRMRASLFGGPRIEDPLVTHARHDEALARARTALARALAGAETGLTEEWVLEDLREAMDRLGEITGAFSTDELYDRVFSTFCIGK